MAQPLNKATAIANPIQANSLFTFNSFQTSPARCRLKPYAKTGLRPSALRASAT
jgi:hypothetical protein